MNKSLAPKIGLWYLGEQNGIDTYWDIYGNLSGPEAYFKVDLFAVGYENNEYQCGQLSGWTRSDAEKWLIDHLQKRIEKLAIEIAQSKKRINSYEKRLDEINKILADG